MAEKLIRDLIPQKIVEKGETPVVRFAEKIEMGDLLRAKLQEEVAEYLESHQPMELVDIFEVLVALAEHHGVDYLTLDDMRDAKARELGSFRGRIVWAGNL